MTVDRIFLTRKKKYAIIHLSTEGGIASMKFKLNIAPECEETVVATVHARSALIDRIEQLVLQDQGDDRIPAYTEDDMLTLKFSDIQLIRTQEGKTFAVDGKGSQYRLKMRLYELEERLPSCFIRINKSALANERYLLRFTSAFSGAVDAVFHSGVTEYVSRRCYADIKRRYSKK